MTWDVDTVRYAGVDGCRAGWVVATPDGVCGIAERLEELVGRFDVVGIDIPVGLPERGRRRCDVEARRFLSPRGATVFPAPVRSVLAMTTYSDANAASRAVDGRGLTRQSFGLFPKIRDADDVVRRHPDFLVEIHPECAFARMAGHPLAPKRSPGGSQARAALLAQHVGPVAPVPAGAATDDVLDAMAVLWSVARFVRGHHACFGGDHDGVGVPMRIVS